MRIGRRVCDARVCETLPSRVLRRTPRPRWPHTIKRAETSSAVSKIALGIPSKDSLVIGEASYPCSLARSAPSSAIDLANDSSSVSNSAPPVVLPAAKAPARAKRVATVSQTVSTTASTGRLIKSTAALMASRDPSEPSKQNSTGPLRLPPVMTFVPFLSTRPRTLPRPTIQAAHTVVSGPLGPSSKGPLRSPTRRFHRETHLAFSSSPQ